MAITVTTTSPMSLDAYTILHAAMTEAEAIAIASALNPVMYEAGDAGMIVIVDGHSVDAARIDLVAEEILGGAAATTALLTTLEGVDLTA
jgi:flagellar biosynthesis/type III secretory pathway M-ring protein FliF/YscJ